MRGDYGVDNPRGKGRAREGNVRRSAPSDRPEDEFRDEVVSVGPVSKTVKGGRRRSFRALVVVGNGKGKVGAGLGKALDLTDAIRKGIEDAKKNLIEVPTHGNTITHEVLGEHGAGMVLLRPASPGTGIIAGRGVRPIMELAGIQDVLAKSLGSANPYNVVYAAMEALKSLRAYSTISELRGKPLKARQDAESEVTPNGIA
ncbi:MAG: 30S ribosomal protein S5 [Bacillota bacterium]|jgi:small subunit ribosomal protein S5